MGEGSGIIGTCINRLDQPSVHDAAAVAGIVNEAASHQNSRVVVIRPREWHLLGLQFRDAILDDISGV